MMPKCIGEQSNRKKVAKQTQSGRQMEKKDQLIVKYARQWPESLG